MSNVTTERTPSKRSNIKTQFQIRDASDVSCSPVTPVRIAPPPVTVKRSKSLKTGLLQDCIYTSYKNNCQKIEPAHSMIIV